MDPRISTTRNAVHAVSSATRPTPTPVRVSFGAMLSAGASGAFRGAQAAVSIMPGGPVLATALRGSVSAATPTGSPEGPSPFASTTTSSGPAAGSVESSLAQAQDMSLYYLQIQEEVNARNRNFTTLSNVLKAEHETVKTAIGNIR